MTREGFRGGLQLVFGATHVWPGRKACFSDEHVSCERGGTTVDYAMPACSVQRVGDLCEQFM